MSKSESLIQQEIVKWFRANYYGNGLIFSVPNERSGYAQMQKLLMTGLLSGVSDLIIVLKGKVLFIEVKNDKGVQSERQKKFESQVKELDFEYHLVRSLEELKKIL